MQLENIHYSTLLFVETLNPYYMNKMLIPYMLKQMVHMFTIVRQIAFICTDTYRLMLGALCAM
jgi:hypothetical protein